MTAAIEISGVRKTFGRKVAVDRLDLSVPEGSLCGFIGPNGAGKTTTIRMIMSIIFPDEGSIEVLGRRSAVESKDRIGYLPEERGVYRKMRVGSFIRYVGSLKGVPARECARRVGAWLDRVGLADCAAKRCEELSKGMQQKVQFIATVIHEPDLIILDEPFSGLDPVNMILLRDLLLEMHAQGRTVIFSTHVMQQAEQLCDRLVMVNGGLKVLDASMDEIRARFDPRRIEVEPMNGELDESALRSIEGVRGIERQRGSVILDLCDDADPPEVVRRAVLAGPMRRVEIKRPTLEEIFVRLVGPEAAPEEVLVRA